MWHDASAMSQPAGVRSPSAQEEVPDLRWELSASRQLSTALSAIAALEIAIVT
jgi:hypothetical protein